MTSEADSRRSADRKEEIGKLRGEIVQDLDHLVERLGGPSHGVKDVIAAISSEEVPGSAAVSDCTQPILEGFPGGPGPRLRSSAHELSQREALRPALLLSNRDLSDMAPRHGHDEIGIIEHPGLNLDASVPSKIDPQSGCRVNDLTRRGRSPLKQPG